MNKQLKKRDRPPGIRAAQLELQEKLYNHPDNHKVIETIYRAALDDEQKNQAAAQAFKVRGVPTFVLYKSGDMKWKKSGGVDKNTLIQQIKSLST